jgi:hypothetical protein
MTNYSVNIFQIVFQSIIFPLLLLPASVSAQVADQNGNYYRNESPVRGSGRPAAGSLWRVTADALNCRSEASINSSVVRVYGYGEILEVEVYRGGSDEVLINEIDAKNRPWMPVRGSSYEDRCFVRANSRFIAPVTR